jgi:hypothetical protein
MALNERSGLIKSGKNQHESDPAAIGNYNYFTMIMTYIIIYFALITNLKG